MHQSVKESEITPELAAKVLKAYILPLFDTETRAIGANARQAYLGKGLSTVVGSTASGATVYGEIKLSVKLMEEMREIKREVEDLKRLLREAKEAAHCSDLDLRNYQEKLTQTESDLHFLLSSHSSLFQSHQLTTLQTSQLTSQLQQIQSNFTELVSKNREYAGLLQIERANGDKLKNRTVELEHSNGLLRMENEIMGERLKGLYLAMESLTGAKAGESLALQEVTKIVEIVKNMETGYQKMMTELSNLLLQKEQYRIDNESLNSQYAEVLEDRSRLTKAAKEHIQSLQTRVRTLEDESIRLKESALKDEKRYRDLLDEYTKLRSKMKQYRQRRKAFGEAEERICRNCQRVYVDADNFNWSCRTHQGEFAEGVWWCCGKQGKEAVGCRVGQHVSKEEEEEGTEQQDRDKETLLMCASCREYGHRAPQCPKDPNYRSRYDIAEESLRLDKISTFKHKSRLSSPDSQLLPTFKRGKEHLVSPCSPSSEDPAEAFTPLETRTAFNDIHKLRSKMPVSPPNVSGYEEINSRNEAKPRKKTINSKSYQSSPKFSGKAIW